MNLTVKADWQRYIFVLPLAMSVTFVMLCWMVDMTRFDGEVVAQAELPRVADIFIKEPHIETFMPPPIKPTEPLPEPKSYDVVNNLNIDDQALNMRPEIELNTFTAPKLIVSSNFSYMGLGQRKVVGPRAKPSYPREAKYAGIEGSVYLEFDISVRGIPTNIRVLESTPVGVFDQAAISAASKWRYARKYSDGEAIATPNFRNRINFRLDEMNLASN